MILLIRIIFKSKVDSVFIDEVKHNNITTPLQFYSVDFGLTCSIHKRLIIIIKVFVGIIILNH